MISILQDKNYAIVNWNISISVIFYVVVLLGIKSIFIMKTGSNNCNAAAKFEATTKQEEEFTQMDIGWSNERSKKIGSCK